MLNNSIALHLENYNSSALYVFADTLYRNFLVSVIFTSPKPTLAQQLIDNTALKKGLANWGVQGNRGSTYDNAVLESADRDVRDNIRNLAKYVMLETPKNPLAWETIGFSLRKLKGRVGMLGAVRGFHQVISRFTSLDEIKLRWKRPLETHKWTRITYRVMRSPDSNFENAVLVGLLTNKCTFTDHVKGLAAVQFYWIIPVNTYGNGMISNVCMAAAIRM